MPNQHPLSLLLLLLLLLVTSTQAETNVEGDYIVILDNNTTNSEALDPSFNITPNSQLDPVLSYLPETTLDQALANIDKAAPDLRQRIISGYTMKELNSNYTGTHEAWYASRPDYMKRMIGRSQRYLYHIVVEVEKRGMPSEIALLPMIESAFNPVANSRSKASGIWQFMPATGKHFGLKQDWWVDNRRDVTAATSAALSYLQKLYGMFGNWDLALAAYNAGEGTVQRAIDRNRKKGLPTDYASLSLPEETKNYVPKLQAIKNIMRKPEVYGLNIDKIPNRPYFTKVIAPEQIDAKLAATLAEVSYEEFISLNPAYNRPVITETGSAHEILLPVSAANTFKLNLANYDKPLVSWQTYHTKRGERMDKIARKFGISVSQLREINDITNSKKINDAQPILVPFGARNNEPLEIDFNSAPDNITLDIIKTTNENKAHSVKPKETLAAIGRQYDVSVNSLMTYNALKNPSLKIGQIINIPNSDLKNQPNQQKQNDKSKVRSFSRAKSSKYEKHTAKSSYHKKKRK
jgi:membrane-bound lytic murein transglycosylase D